MQMTTQSDFDFGLDANYQTKILFDFSPLTIHEIRFINKPSHSSSLEHY